MIAALALLAPLAGCGSGQPPRVPEAQREAIERAFAHDAQRLSLPGAGCFNVTRPVTPETRRTYALLVRVAREDPEAVIPNEDGVSPTIRQSLARRARVIDVCLSRYPEADRGWADLSRGIWSALAEMEG